MSKGILRIYTKDNQYDADIISLVNQDTEGEYVSPTWDTPPEYKILTYDLGICECFDMKYHEEIESVEIIELNVGFDTEYSTDVELVKYYYDYNHNCFVVEFKEG